MIYTSYYAKWRKAANGLVAGVSISIKAPEWFTGLHLPALGPASHALTLFKNGTWSIETFTDAYLFRLKSTGLTPEKIVSMLPENPALLCWERKGLFCHRHVLADYLRAAGYEVMELRGALHPFAGTHGSPNKGGRRGLSLGQATNLVGIK